MIVAAHAITHRRGPATVLRDVSFAVQPGAVVGLIGPNGAGKTSLMRLLAGLESPGAGRVTYDGRTRDAIGRAAFGRTVAYLPQNGLLHWPLTVAEVVALGRLPHGGAAVDAAVERAMARTGVADLAGRTVGTLSGGERARALLARALAVEAPILLADEPVAALDPYHQLEIMALLRDMARAGASVVCVLHDLALAARFCDRIVLLKAGALLADGPAASVMTPGFIAEAYGVSVASLQHGGETVVIPWSRHVPSEENHP